MSWLTAPAMQRQPVMFVALVPALVAIALFVATLTMEPRRARLTLLPPRPRS